MGNDNKCYTYKKRPVKLVYHALFNDIRAAIGFEKQIKKWRRDKKKALIEGDWDRLSNLSKRYT